MCSLSLIRRDLQRPMYYAYSEIEGCSRHHLNELPWSGCVLPEVRLNEYPSCNAKNQLRARLAEIYAVSPQQLLVTRGSDEGLDVLMRLFLEPKQDAILQCPPTFSMYAFFAQLQQALMINATRDNHFQLKLASIQQAWTPQCKLIFLCRPNNPTGELMSLEDISALCRFVDGQSMVVVDEAYIEFAAVPSAITLLNQYDNLIVLRTLSKAYGLAGLRLGSVIAQSKLIQALESIMLPFSLSSIVIQTAMQALTDLTWLQKSIQTIITSRLELAEYLKRLAWIETVFDSHANFLLLKTSFQAELVAFLTQNNIAVRSFTELALQKCIRISIGDGVMNQRVCSLLQTFTKEYVQ